MDPRRVGSSPPFGCWALAVLLAACSSDRTASSARDGSVEGGTNAGASAGGRAGNGGQSNGGAATTAGANGGGRAGATSSGGAAGTTSSAGGSATSSGGRAGGTGSGGTPDTVDAGDASTQAVAYPVKRSANGRYLVDQNGAPYLIAGDAPQSLTVNLSEAQAEMYFANRERHGFNAAWVNLLCASYTGGRADASTYDGILPFTKAGDLSTPNEAFFQRVDHMLAIAARHGINVFLVPAETGSFLSVLTMNGATKARAYGQYLGARYRDVDNIVWMSGNDFQDWRVAESEAVVKAVAQGIQDRDTRHIHTAELDYPTSSSSEDTDLLPLLSLDAAYTYFPTYAQVLKSYDRSSPLPVFMVEGVYEFESNEQAHEATPATLRRQEYWTNLSGATGQLYGNHYTWTFASGWEGKLDTPGAIQMAYVKALFEPRPWYDLVPDEAHSVVTKGYGTFTGSGHVDDSDYVTAARTPNGALVMAYVPDGGTVTIDMTKLRGQTIARWYDPSRGTTTDVAGSPLSNQGTHDFTTPGPNGDGDADWVLVLEAP